MIQELRNRFKNMEELDKKEGYMEKIKSTLKTAKF